MSNSQSITNALAGICASLVAFVSTSLPMIEAGIRITSGVLGIVVALVTLFRFYQHRKL